MLLTITYTGHDTQNISFLFFKNPSRPQFIELNYGKAYVFYPEVTDERTTIALLLDIDPIDLARGKVGSSAGGLFDYVNDRPYVASSFMSTAVAKVFGTAMTGRGDKFQTLADSPLTLSATIHMLPLSGEPSVLARIFEPLGYKIDFETFMSDEKFDEWGMSKYGNLTITGEVRLRDLLKHIYVLIPVFDRQKHYWVGKSEVDKLLSHASDWLPQHPERAYITGRYLNRNKSLVNLAFRRINEINEMMEEESGISSELKQQDNQDNQNNKDDENLYKNKLSLNTQRLGSVVAALKSVKAKSVIDIGCGDGKLLVELMKERQFEKIAGTDVSCAALSKAESNLKLDTLSETARQRMELFQSSLIYRDARYEGFDAACIIEVIEHLDPFKLAVFERVLFEFARPKYIVITTPNIEYNRLYESLAPEKLRHSDHRFEWTREQFRNWAETAAEKFGYTVVFSEIGDRDETSGAPTQMGVFTQCL